MRVTEIPEYRPAKATARQKVRSNATSQCADDVWLVSLIIFRYQKNLQVQFYIRTDETNSGYQVLRSRRNQKLWQRLLRCDVVQVN